MPAVPGAIEMMDQLITQAVEAAYHFGFPLDAGAVLIVELDGPEAECAELAGHVRAIANARAAVDVQGRR